MKERFWISFNKLRGNRLALAIFALYLVAIPTAFSVFPGLTVRLDRCSRIFVMATWVVVAVFATVAGLSKDRDDELLALDNQELLIHHYLGIVLSPASTGIPDFYELHVHRREGDRLYPIYPAVIEDSDDYRVFDSGQGAVGRALSLERPAVAVGDAVWDESHDLSDMQRAQFADVAVVVAVPIRQIGGQQEESHRRSPVSIESSERWDILFRPAQPGDGGGEGR